MLISIEDVETAMAATFTDAQRSAIEDVIQGLEDDLQTFLKRPLTPQVVVDEEVKYRDGRIRLSKTPVRSVEAFSIAGTPIAATSYRVESWGLTDVSTVFGPSSLLVPDPVLLVSYTGGLGGDDPESDFGRAVRSKLKAATKRIATQEVIEKAIGVDRLSVEGTSISFIGRGTWLDSELTALRRFQRRIVRT